MNRRFGSLFFGLILALAGCRSTTPPPAGPTAPGTGPPAQPNPAPVPVTPPPAPPAVPTRPPASAAPVAAASIAPVAVPDAAPASAAAPAPLAAAVPVQAAIPPPSPRPHQDILKLKQAGFSDEFLLNKIRTDNVNYQLTTVEMVELRSAGITEAVLDAMLRSGQPAAATAGAPVARKAEFYGLARVGKGFLVFGTAAKKTGRLVVDGDTVAWYDSEDPKKNFSIYSRNIKEIFNTCALRPGQNLCLEFGFVTFTGEEYRFRDPGWKNGENKLILDATTYFRQAFPNLFFSQRAVSEL